MGRDQQQRPYNRPVTDEAIFKAAKEITVKFIEVGRLTPAGFDRVFSRVHASLRRAAGRDDQS